MKIGILGSGLMGGKLGTLWAKSGHDITFSFARSEQKLSRLAEEAGARYGSVADAVKDADAVLEPSKTPKSITPRGCYARD